METTPVRKWVKLLRDAPHGTDVGPAPLERSGPMHGLLKDVRESLAVAARAPHREGATRLDEVGNRIDTMIDALRAPNNPLACTPNLVDLLAHPFG